MAIIDYRVEDGIAILTWDDKDRPMNVLSGDSLAELSAGVEKAVADDAVKGIILTSGKRGVFVAGGGEVGESVGVGLIVRLSPSVVEVEHADKATNNRVQIVSVLYIDGNPAPRP